MMQERGRISPAEQPPDLELPPGRIEQVFASDDEIDPLLPIVDDHGELIRPVAIAVAGEDIPTLRRRLLLLRPEPEIVKPFHRIVDPDAKTEARRFRKVSARARAGIAMTRDVAARARARVDQTAAAKGVEGRLVDGVPFALADDRTVSRKTEPAEILQDRVLKGRSASLAIMIFDTKQHAAVRAGRARGLPDPDGVEHVAEMKEAGGGRRETSGQ